MIFRNTFLSTTVFALSLIGATDAFAGKPERDKVAELTPTVQEAKDSIKSTCGCPIGVEVKWDSYADVAAMNGIYGAIGTLASNIKSHCGNDADKKAVCENVTDAEILFGSTAEVK